MKKLFAVCAFGLSLQTPVSAITYTWGESSVQQSTYTCSVSGGVCTLTVNNFKLNLSDSGTWSPYAGSDIGSITLTGGGQTYTITNQTVTFSPPVPAPAAAFLPYQNNLNGFTIGATGGPEVLDQSFLITFGLNTPASPPVPNDKVFISTINWPTNITNGLAPSGLNGSSGPYALSTWIEGQSAPGPLAFFALLPILSLGYKKRFLMSLPMNSANN